MKAPQIMVNGLPGSMASGVAQRVYQSEDLKLHLHGIGSPNRSGSHFHNADPTLQDGIAPHVLVLPPKEYPLADLPTLAVDYTSPKTIHDMVDFYCENTIPFVMGTTGGDREALEQRVRDSNTVAVIAPNMAKNIVGIQDVMQRFADLYEGSFEGVRLRIHESHQKTKKDTSGTAKAFVNYFNQLGIDFSVDEIHKTRTEEGYKLFCIPEEHWDGHGWHSYELSANIPHHPGFIALHSALSLFIGRIRGEYNLRSNSTMVRFRGVNQDYSTTLLKKGKGLFITHNVNGREPYFDGTMDAIRFLLPKIAAGEKGNVYSMIDVLKGN